MTKLKPERTCISCRKKGEKSNFIKIVYNKSGETFIEKDKNINGRGAYICKCADCILKCIKTKALNRAFKTNISPEIYKELESEFKSIKD